MRRQRTKIAPGTKLAGRSSPALAGLCALLVLTISVFATPTTTAVAQPAAPRISIEPPLTTEWTHQVSQTDPLPEYPRPQLVREDWLNLNGPWEWEAIGPDAVPPLGRTLTGTILVPYPVQSALSGIMREQRDMAYRRTFEVPENWADQRTVLHFGAVTSTTTVFVNGTEVGDHVGSYDGFSFDITDSLNPIGENELVVGVHDRSLADTLPVGKQFPTSISVLFTASSGIWQTVWIEPVMRTHLERMDQTPDVVGQRLQITPHVTGDGSATIVVRASDGRGEVGSASGPANDPLKIDLRRLHLWSPDDPFLYDLEIEVRQGSKVVDRATSYFGMRSVGLAKVGGVTRPVLNGKFEFQIGPLDQGYWPDGIYTAPTDDALRSDLENEKRAGYNMVRKHVKVEPDRWYYWADKLGILVWQDMPNTQTFARPTKASKTEFRKELKAMIDQKRSHPSIVSWIPFNEGWGQFDVSEITDWVKGYDPSRLVNGHSGAANCCLAEEPKGGDIIDTHMYNGPFGVAPDERASVVGEMGAVAVSSPGHEWPEGPNTPDRPTPMTVAQTEGRLRRQYAALEQEMRTPGISGAVYTEMFDVERELVGFITYDRKVDKVDFSLLHELNTHLIAASRRPDGVRPLNGRVPKDSRGLWHLDEGKGTVAADASGSDHALRVRGGATWVEGKHGKALAFDGSDGRATSHGPVVDTANSFTIGAWLRQDDHTQAASAVSQGNADEQGFALEISSYPKRGDLEPGYAIYGLPQPTKDSAPWRWTFEIRSNRADNGYGEGPTKPAEGIWHYVVGVVDRDNQVAQIFVDGEPYDTQSAGSPWEADSAFVLGGADLDSGTGFIGAVDEVRAYDRALNPAEVWQLYAAETGQKVVTDMPAKESQSSGESRSTGSVSGWLVAAGVIAALMVGAGSAFGLRRRHAR